MTVEIKVCGITRPEDARRATSLGAAYGGMIFSDVSPRLVTLERARLVSAALGARRVGVFVDQELSDVLRCVDAGGLDVVQLHGDESEALVRSIRERRPVAIWQAVRVRDTRSIEESLVRFSGIVDGFLFDAYDPRMVGGTGRTFRWDLLEGVRAELPAGSTLILAGGLDADNVAEAIQHVRPDVIDVSSGVEVSPGRKSEHRMRAFFTSVSRAQTRPGAGS